MSKLSDGFKNNWETITQFAAWIITTASSFMIKIPIGDATLASNNPYINFNSFVIAGFVALTAIPISIFKKKVHGKGWLIIAVVCFIMAIVTFIVYAKCVRDWSVVYQTPVSDRITIGKTLTEEGKKYYETFSSSYRQDTAHAYETLVRDCGGNVYRFWNKDEIESRIDVFSFLFIFWHVGFALFVISVLQAAKCYNKTR